MDLVNGRASSKGIKSYRAMVADVAGMLAPLGTDKVAIEQFNEPAHYPCGAGGDHDWQKIMATTVKDIRAVSPELTIVATGACGGDITGLVDLKPKAFDDPNILYSFHMYAPHSFAPASRRPKDVRLGATVAGLRRDAGCRDRGAQGAHGGGGPQ